jgi:flagellar basal body-associated protein FliL
MVDLRKGSKVFEMKLFRKIRVYKLLIKASLKKALLNALYSSLIVFSGSLAAQLQNSRQITVITVVTAALTALVTFLTEFRENYPVFKLLLEYKVAAKDAEKVLRFMRLAFKASRFKGND